LGGASARLGLAGGEGGAQHRGMTPSATPSPRRAHVALAVLTLAYVFSFLDRIVINLLVEPMKRDLGLSDVQISLLMGLSFSVFYTLCEIGRAHV
jgi:sugar phosphate permease